MDNIRDCVFEIGTEEIPARFMRKTMADIEGLAVNMLQEERLTYNALKVLGTPRRLVLYIEGLVDNQPDLVREMRGPSAKVAFDADGNPTKALQGFARSCGVDVSDIVVKDTESGQYAHAMARDKGEEVSVVLSRIFPAIITSLTFPKAMRWASSDFRFVRPIRWLLAIFGEDVIDFEIAGIKAGKMTAGHRTISPGMHQVTTAKSYFGDLREHGVIVDQEERKSIIGSQLKEIAEQNGGVAVIEESLLEEVTFILEWPTGFVGNFDSSYLDIPEPCITTPMQEHQRYFPVRNSKGKLMSKFIAFRNGNEKSLETVVAGNERVLRARLADAKFFYAEDMMVPLVERTKELANVTFQESLGSMEAKCIRNEELVKFLVSESKDESWRNTDDKVIELLARNCKTDLVTSVVREFAELQGIMGCEYMIRQGFEPDIAIAIAEHYMPRFAEDELPSTAYGSLLAIADKIDTVVGYFALGLIPTGSTDPYSLRRQTLGVVLIALKHPDMVSIKSLVRKAYELHAAKSTLKLGMDETVEEVMKFIGGRIDNIMSERNISHDVIEAVSASGYMYPSRVIDSAMAIENIKKDSSFADYVAAFSRVKNIAVHATTHEFDQKKMTNPSDIFILTSYLDVLGKVEGLADVNEEIKCYISMTPAINKFFEDVMVMDEDQEVRTNRLAILASIEKMCTMVADFSKVQI